MDVWTDPLDSAYFKDKSNIEMLAPGVGAPRRYVARANIEDSYEVMIEVRVTVVGPFADSVSVVPRNRGSITSEALRKIPVATILSQSLEDVAFILFQDGRRLRGTSPSLLIMPAELRGEWPNGDHVADVLDWVSIVYRLATALGKGPTAQVAKAASVSRATAGRMVLECRKRGLLSEFETPQFNPSYGLKPVTKEDIEFLVGYSKDKTKDDAEQ